MSDDMPIRFPDDRPRATPGLVFVACPAEGIGSINNTNITATALR